MQRWLCSNRSGLQFIIRRPLQAARFPSTFSQPQPHSRQNQCNSASALSAAPRGVPAAGRPTASALTSPARHRSVLNSAGVFPTSGTHWETLTKTTCVSLFLLFLKLSNFRVWGLVWYGQCRTREGWSPRGIYVLPLVLIWHTHKFASSLTHADTRRYIHVLILFPSCEFSSKGLS